MPFLLSCITTSSSGCVSPEGQSFDGSLSHGDPSHHLDFSICRNVYPLLGRTAGFIAPGTCRQDSLVVGLLIAFILFQKISHIILSSYTWSQTTSYSSVFYLKLPNTKRVFVSKYQSTCHSDGQLHYVPGLKLGPVLSTPFQKLYKKFPRKWLQKMIQRRSVTSSYVNGDVCFVATPIEIKTPRKK